MDLYSGQDKIAFGNFLLETVAGMYDCKPDITLISRAVSQHTGCGAWIVFDDQGILVGTICDGPNEYSERINLKGIEADDEGAARLRCRLCYALAACDQFADDNMDVDRWDYI